MLEDHFDTQLPCLFSIKVVRIKCLPWLQFDVKIFNSDVAYCKKYIFYKSISYNRLATYLNPVQSQIEGALVASKLLLILNFH